MRVVSLIASATEILHALGLGSSQVGRSHECDFPDSVVTLPVCTRPRFDTSGSSADIDRRVRATLRDAASVYHVDAVLMAQLRPTHILTQSHCRVCAVSREDVEHALSSCFPTAPEVVALEPNTLDDVLEDFRRVARACRHPDAGDRLVESTRARFASVHQLVDGLSARPRVAAIEWIEPLMSAGNWMPELISLAGGVPLFTAPGGHSPYLEWKQLVEADPDFILIAPCGFALARTAAEMRWLTSRPAWPELAAVRNARVFLADGNQLFNRPGPRLADSLELLAALLHAPASLTPSPLWREMQE